MSTKIILEFDDKISDRMIKALSVHFGYPTIVTDGEKQVENPQPVEDFVAATLQDLITGFVQDAEVKTTIQDARNNAENAINALRQTAKDTAADLAIVVSFQK